MQFDLSIRGLSFLKKNLNLESYIQSLSLFHRSQRKGNAMLNDIDQSYIKERVKDWKDRLNHLYLLVEEILFDQKNIVCKKTRHTILYEELMQKYNVNSEDIPILDIYKNKMIIATFKPVGLWVIGANGRIDILTESGAYIVVDTAETGKKPAWKVFTPKNRKSGKNLDSSLIMELVNQA